MMLKKYQKVKMEKISLCYTNYSYQLMIQKKLYNALKKNFLILKNQKKKIFVTQLQIDKSAVKKIAKECDMFFVIGSRNSSNSVRLVEVAKNNGCENSELIHSESNFHLEKIC